MVQRSGHLSGESVCTHTCPASSLIGLSLISRVDEDPLQRKAAKHSNGVLLIDYSVLYRHVEVNNTEHRRKLDRNHLRIHLPPRSDASLTSDAKDFPPLSAGDSASFRLFVWKPCTDTRCCISLLSYSTGRTSTWRLLAHGAVE